MIRGMFFILSGVWSAGKLEDELQKLISKQRDYLERAYFHDYHVQTE